MYVYSSIYQSLLLSLSAYVWLLAKSEKNGDEIDNFIVI